jgi:O-acetyl-ADP-ribose deacetylase (regulator of RNase III)
MKIEYVFGSLLASPVPVIAHGCNAQGVMKSGVAKDIRAQYPQAYEDYIEVHHHTLRGLCLGDVIITRYPGRTILNIISQEFFGRDPSIRYVSYDAIAKAIERINKLGYGRVAFPMIGAGLANGNWSVISSIIESYSDFTPVVYYIDEGLKETFGDR